VRKLCHRVLAGRPDHGLARHLLAQIVLGAGKIDATIFNSDLFHETGEIRFREGYENRRVNVTMLYGRRGDTGV
jgi:hypothetical protein